ncbi:MAG: MarR family transcriptional regulator [Cyclobacteriaceae bacterium]
MIPSSLEDNIIYQTGRFTKHFSERLTDAFKKAGHNITSEQFAILAVLWYQDGITQQQIATAIERDKTTISRVLDSMIKRNLLRREKSESDKRSKLIRLTDHGKQLQEKLVSISGKLFMQSLEGIEDTDVKSALKVMHRLINNISK